MTSTDPISRRVVETLAAVIRKPPETMTMESSLAELGFDSLDAINAMFELEDKFGISIPDDHFRTLVTVGDVVTGIRKLLEAKSASRP